MPWITIQIPNGVNRDDTSYSAKPKWIETDKIRFRGGKIERIGGWDRYSDYTFTGKCRGLMTWLSNNGNECVAVGTHQKLYVYKDGWRWDVTPIRSTGTLAAAPIATTNGSSTVTVTHTSHGATDGAVVYLSGATAVAGVTVGGGTGTLAASPFETTANSRIVIVSHTAHGLVSGDIASFASASATGGITINGDYTVWVTGADTYYIEHSSAATSDSTGGGTPSYEYFKAHTLTYVSANTYTITGTGTASSSTSGGGASVKFKYEINIGNEDASLSGFGSGLFGAGGFGASADPQELALATWSLAQWGQNLVAARRNTTIYEWSQQGSARAVAISGAPSRVAWIFVTPERHLCAAGTHDGSTFQPMLVRWTDQEVNTDWTASATDQAGDFPLAEGAEIVAAAPSVGQNLIWTDSALYSMRYLGGEPWFSFDVLGTGCGLIAPNAYAIKDGFAAWCSNAGSFYVYRGGAPEPIACPLRKWFFDQLAPSQKAKIAAGIIGEYNEVIWFAPSGTGNAECNIYVKWNWVTGDWDHGTFDRTAWADRAPLDAPIAAGTDGYLYFHETGYTALGSPVTAYAKAILGDIQEGQTNIDVFGIIPDAVLGGGSMQHTFTGQDKPNSTPETFGPYAQTSADDQIDFRASGRLFTWRVDFPDSYFGRLGAVRADVQPAGNRR